MKSEMELRIRILKYSGSIVQTGVSYFKRCSTFIDIVHMVYIFFNPFWPFLQITVYQLIDNFVFASSFNFANIITR